MSNDPLINATLQVAGHAVASAGMSLLDRWYKDHRPKARENAKVNGSGFLEILEARIEMLEEKLEGGAGGLSAADVQEALDDPDFAYSLEQATVASARTSSRLKHELLSSAVVERLASKSESARALVTNRAIEIIPALTTNQINWLGLCTLIYELRPTSVLGIPDVETRKRWLREFWPNVVHLYKDGTEINNTDYYHLVGMGCITFVAYTTNSLAQIMETVDEQRVEWGAASFLDGDEVAKQFADAWTKGSMQRSKLTSVGTLIGIYTHAEKTKVHIDMSKWDFNR